MDGSSVRCASSAVLDAQDKYQKGKRVPSLKNGYLIGTVLWAGTIDDLPAFASSYYGGASLFAFDGDDWFVYAKGKGVKSVTPHLCEKCGEQLPKRMIEKEQDYKNP